MKNSYILILLSLSLSLSSFAQKEVERVELMKYVIKQESKHTLHTKWTSTWFNNFHIINEAEAYKAGEPCLILGFKSEFKNGVCRLSAVEGIKEFRNACPKDELPCNPQVFGRPSADKPFCISASSGRELSKTCAKKTFKHLSRSDSPLLKEMNPFDLEKLKLTPMDAKLANAFKEIYQYPDTSLEEATKFTAGLCADIKNTTKTGMQSSDLKTCQHYLTLLKKVDLVPEDPIARSVPPIPVEAVPTLPQSIANEDVCKAEDIEPKVTELIKDVTKVVDHKVSDKWLSCINKLEAHPTVSPKLKEISEYSKETERHFEYWHELDGEKTFGLRCNEFSFEGPHEFYFINSTGIKKATIPRDQVKGAENVSKIKYKDGEYYIIRDMLGGYFELDKKSKVTSLHKDAQNDIRKFEKNGGPLVSELKEVADEDSGRARECLKQRMFNYFDWITYPYGVIPLNASQYNADVKIYNDSLSTPAPGKELKEKYQRTIDEVKKDIYEKAMNELPDCGGIFTQSEFDENFDKKQVDSTKYYNRMRSNLGLDKP